MIEQYNEGFIRPLHNIGVLEAASGCNLRCPSCVSWTEKGKDFLTLDIAKKAVEKFFLPLGIKQVQLYWRGDPCINPQLPEIAEYVQSQGLVTIISTNGITKYNRNEEWMTKLLKHVDYYCVCLDGWNPDNIAKYRVGSKWETMMNNLEMLNRIESNTKKILAVLMFKHNEGHESFFHDIASKYNMRLDLKAPDILGHHVLPDAIAEEWLSTKLEYSRYDYVSKETIPANFEWRGNIIDVNKLSDYVWVHRTPELCEEGNLIFAADGTIPYGGQFTRDTKGLGSVDSTLDEVMDAYKAINERMYNMELPECKNQCLCLVKPR